jgi:anti-sigma factor RsiW
MSHLGDRLSALVDGELSHEERDRLYVHLAACAECRAEATALRALKRRLGALGDTAMDRGLLSRLISLAEPGEPPVTQRRRPAAGGSGGSSPRASTGSPAPHPAVLMYPDMSVPAGGRQRLPLRGRGSTAGPQIRPPGRRRAPYLVAGAFSALILGVGGVSFLAGGGQDSPGPRITPPVGMFTVEHSVTTGDVPFLVPAASVIRAGTGRRGGP